MVSIANASAWIILLCSAALAVESSAAAAGYLDGSPHDRAHPQLRQRRLALGDFDTLNAVLQEVELPIAETPVITQDVAGAALTIGLSHITCRHLRLGDAVVAWRTPPPLADANASATSTTLRLANNVTLRGVSLDCSMHYNYSYLFFNGEGDLELKTSNNTLETGTRIATTTTTTATTTTTTNATANGGSDTSVAMTDCRAEIRIDDIAFDGEGLGLVGSALDAVEGLLRGTVEDRMQAYFCTFLGDFQAPLQAGLDRFLDLLAQDGAGTDYAPLRAENGMTVPDTVDLLNLQSPDAGGITDRGTLSMLLDQISGYLSGSNSDGELNLNAMLRQFLLDDDGSLTVDLSRLFSVPGQNSSTNGLAVFDSHTELGTWALYFTSAKVSGLDSFNRIEPLTAIGKYTLESAMTLDHVSVQLDATFEMTAANKSLTETFALDMTLSDISLATALLLAIDMNQFGQLPLGAFLNVKNILPCIVSSIFRLQSSGLQIQHLVVEPPVVTGFASVGLQRVMSEGLAAIFKAYNPLLDETVPHVIESTIASMMNDALQNLAETDQNTACQASTATDPDAFIDFRDLFLRPAQAKDYGAPGSSPYGDLAIFLKQFVDNKLLSVNADTGRTGLADMIMVPLTESQSGIPGTLAMKEPISFAGDINIGEETANLEFNLQGVRIDNLDSVGAPLRLLDPVHDEAYLLNNTVTIGVSPYPVTLKGNVSFLLSKDDQTIHDDISFSIDLDAMRVLSMVLVKLSEESLMTFPLRDIFMWDCWLATIPAPQLDENGIRVKGMEPTLSFSDLSMSIHSMNFAVDCMNCSSSKIEDFAHMVSSNNLNTDVTKSATNVMNVMLETLSGPSSFLQYSIDRLLADAPKFCPHSPVFDPNATKTEYNAFQMPEQVDRDVDDMVAVLTTLLTTAGTIVVLHYGVQYYVATRHKKWLESLPKSQIMDIYLNQMQEREDEIAVNRYSKSLFLSQDIPKIVRVFVPLVLLGNIGLFLSGHLNLGGSVELHLQVGGETVVFSNFYTFSIAQSGVELWNAGYKPLAFLMLLFSGIWPYLKQMTTIVLWFLTPAMVSTSRRGSLLLWMDFLAKWSMIDVFVMIMCLAAFRVQIFSPDLSFLPSELYQIDIMIVAKWGLYANMLAQLLSQVTSHFIIAYHRLVVFNAMTLIKRERRQQLLEMKAFSDPEFAAYDQNAAKNADTEAAQQAKILPSTTSSTTADSLSDESQSYDDYPLSRHAFVRPHRGEAEKLVVRRGVNQGLVFAGFVTVVLTIVGCCLPAVSFDYQGLIGIAMESGKDFQQAKEYISIFSLAKLLMAQASFLGAAKDIIGMLAVSVLLIFSTFCVPLALIAVLLVEWFGTHTTKARRTLRSVVEILQAWQYIEVFVLSVVVASWQIGDVSELLLDEYCGGSFGSRLSQLALWGLIKPEDAKCFRVQPAIESAAFILLAAGIMIIILGSFVSKAVVQRNRDETRTDLGETAPSRLCQESEDFIVPIHLVRPVPVLFTDQFRWLLVRSSPSTS